MNLEVLPSNSFDVEIDNISSDKSITHRAFLLSLFTEKSVISNPLLAEDTLSTLNSVKSLGADVSNQDNVFTIKMPALVENKDYHIECNNSGTLARIGLGAFTNFKGNFKFTGDESLTKRPMRRVIDPLKSIGASIDSNDGKMPIHMKIVKQLDGFDYYSKISSAQVKSALLYSALHAKNSSIFEEVEKSRNHTEIMFKNSGINLEEKKNKIYISPMESPIKKIDFSIPSDISSAIFFVVAAIISDNGGVKITNVLYNETRFESIKKLIDMNANIEIIEEKNPNSIEKTCTILATSSNLNPITIDENIAWLIDEIPILSIAMSEAKGKSSIKNIKELRFKESDRINSIVVNLRKCGIEVEEEEESIHINGGKGSTKNVIIETFMDHRIAMSFAIYGIKYGIRVDDVDCINTSFPSFFEIMNKITNIKVD